MFWLTCLPLVAQHIPLTQYENAPFMYNPAHMNLRGEASLGVQYRHQPMFVGLNFQAFALSGEYSFWDRNRINKSTKDIKPTRYHEYVQGGFGFTILGEKQGNLLNTNGLFLRYNHILRAGKGRISLAPQVAFLQNSVQLQNVITDNQISTDFLETNSTTNENFANFQKGYASVGMGALWFLPDEGLGMRGFLGISAFHLNRPVLSSLDNGESRLPILGSLQAGYRFDLTEKWGLMPHVRLLSENTKMQTLVGLKGLYNLPTHRTLHAEVAYNTRQNLTFGAGIRQASWQARLTYDIPLGVGLQREYLSSQGAWELALAYHIQRKFKQPKPKQEPIKDTLTPYLAKMKVKKDSTEKALAQLKILEEATKEKQKADSVANAQVASLIKTKLEPIKDTTQLTTQTAKIDSVDIFTDLDTDILYFGLGNNTLTPISLQILERNLELLQKNPNLRANLIGHTCNTGTPDKNVILSKERAEKVKAILVGKGIDASRIKAIGMGDKEPVIDHNTDKNRQQNRRVEIILDE